MEAAHKLQQTVAEQAPVRVMPPPPPPPPVAKPSTSTAEAPVITVRPTIKLKHNASTSKLAAAAIPTDTPKSTPKPKGRKPKVIDAPPPPYVDDGSHDILQEVIAIEQEKRHRSTSEKDRPPEKRKRPSPEDEEDNILTSAIPLSSKKKNPVPVASTAPVEKSVAPKATPIPREGASTATTVRISLKGKEKEVAPAPAPPKPKRSSAPATPINEKKCREVLKILLRLPEAIIFARPVNPVLDGCPT